MIKHFRQHCEQTLSFGLSVCPDGHRNEEKKYFFIRLSENIWEIKLLQRFWWQFGENYQKNYGAKLSFFIMMVPNCPGAKFSVFTMLVPNLLFFILVPNCLFAFLVPNCPFLPSWCQIVQVPNCPVPNCPTTDVYTYLSMTQECLVFRFQKIYSRLSTLRE